MNGIMYGSPQIIPGLTSLATQPSKNKIQFPKRKRLNKK